MIHVLLLCAYQEFTDLQTRFYTLHSLRNGVSCSMFFSHVLIQHSRIYKLVYTCFTLKQNLKTCARNWCQHNFKLYGVLNFHNKSVHENCERKQQENSKNEYQTNLLVSIYKNPAAWAISMCLTSGASDLKDFPQS